MCQFVTSRIEFFRTARMKPLKISQTAAETDLGRQTPVARVMIDHLIFVQGVRIVARLNTPDEIGRCSFHQPRENSVITIVLLPRSNAIVVVIQCPFLYARRENLTMERAVSTNRDHRRRVPREDQWWCRRRHHRHWCSTSSRTSCRTIDPRDRTSRSNHG